MADQKNTPGLFRNTSTPTVEFNEKTGSARRPANINEAAEKPRHREEQRLQLEESTQHNHAQEGHEAHDEHLERQEHGVSDEHLEQASHHRNSAHLETLQQPDGNTHRETLSNAEANAHREAIAAQRAEDAASAYDPELGHAHRETTGASPSDPHNEQSDPELGGTHREPTPQSSPSTTHREATPEAASGPHREQTTEDALSDAAEAGASKRRETDALTFLENADAERRRLDDVLLPAEVASGMDVVPDTSLQTPFASEKQASTEGTTIDLPSLDLEAAGEAAHRIFISPNDAHTEQPVAKETPTEAITPAAATTPRPAPPAAEHRITKLDMSQAAIEKLQATETQTRELNARLDRINQQLESRPRKPR